MTAVAASGFYLRIVVTVVLCSWSGRPTGPTTVLHTFVVAGSCWQPQTFVKPEGAITVFELLMMSGVSLETC